MRNESQADAPARPGGESDSRLVKPDHRPRRRYTQGILTQREIIRLFKGGVYYVEEYNGDQPTLNRGGRQVKTWRDENGRCWVRLYWQGKRKQTPLAIIVWLSKTLNVIPKHFEIHHDDCDNRNDKWENLFCLHKLDHRKMHHGASAKAIPF